MTEDSDDVIPIIAPHRHICTPILNRIPLDIQVKIMTVIYWVPYRYEPNGSDAESESSQSDYSSHDSDDRLADLMW